MTAEDHYYTGLDLFGAGKVEEAITEYRSALALDPKFTDALHGLARGHLAKNDFDSAIVAAQRILELDPDDILAWTALARAYQLKGMLAEAEHAGNKARVLVQKKKLQGQEAKIEGS